MAKGFKESMHGVLKSLKIWALFIEANDWQTADPCYTLWHPNGETQVRNMHQNLSRNLVGMKYKGWHEGKHGISLLFMYNLQKTTSPSNWRRFHMRLYVFEVCKHIKEFKKSLYFLWLVLVCLFSRPHCVCLIVYVCYVASVLASMTCLLYPYVPGLFGFYGLFIVNLWSRTLWFLWLVNWFHIVLLPENLRAQAWILYKAPQWNARYPNSCPERIKL